ncbi:MAG: hypothetical protein K2P99_04035 [Burkholderiales bacterium]|nr:hypothetical protein [Burkholderiales bacterium]
MKKAMPIWLSETGEKVSCIEKIKVMQQNLQELQQMAQDAYEDGILMGIAPKQLKQFILELMNNLHNPYLRN